MKCEYCNNDFQRLGQHWAFNPEHRPEFTSKQIELIKGVLMGDATYNSTESKNPKITVSSANKDYLENIDKKLSPLTTGVKLYKTAKQSALKAKNSGFHEKATKENYSDMYRLSTRSHPQLKLFSDWYDKSKTFPENLELTPTTLKHWYVCDGSLQKNHLKIALTNEKDNREKIEKIFQRQNLPKPNTWVKKDYGLAIWNKKESKQLFEYMGDKMPCYSYKFPKNSS